MNRTDPAPSAPTLGYLPALDGLRGLAAAGIVAFHAQMTWMRGGFLAVTTFFALSGFLLTSLLLREIETDGTVDARAFWGRRFRRLLPAALATLALVSVLAPWLATPEQLASLRGDVLAALFYVANWRFVFEERSYAELFADPSPVQQFWTLSVEEQIFLVLPVAVLGLVVLARRLGRSPRATLAAGLGAATLASTAWMWVSYDASSEGLAAYYSTFTRSAEFLLGALAALAVGSPGPLRSVRAQRFFAALAGPALIAVLACWVLVVDGAAWLYRGGFAGVAALSCIAIVGSLQPGPVRAVLALRPLRAVGRRTYGIYLVHWPILLWCTSDRTGLDGLALLALQLTLIATLAAASFRWLETPIRMRRRVTTGQARVVTPCAFALVAGAAIISTATAPAPELVFDRLPDPAPAATTPGASEPTRVLVVGDSLARNLAGGLQAVAPPSIAVYDRTSPGCGLNRDERLVQRTGWQPMGPECLPPWPERFADAVASVAPEVVVLHVGTQELWDRRVEGEVVAFDSDAGRARRAEELREAIDLLGADGAQVVLVSLPVIDWRTWGLVLADPARSVNNPAWVQDWNALLVELAGEPAYRDRVVVADLAQVLTPEGTYRDQLDGVTVRAGDGLHLTEAGAAIAGQWLLDYLEPSDQPAGPSPSPP